MGWSDAVEKHVFLCSDAESWKKNNCLTPRINPSGKNKARKQAQPTLLDTLRALSLRHWSTLLETLACHCGSSIFVVDLGLPPFGRGRLTFQIPSFSFVSQCR